jgi:hypothetical protein
MNRSLKTSTRTACTDCMSFWHSQVSTPFEPTNKGLKLWYFEISLTMNVFYLFISKKHFVNTSTSTFKVDSSDRAFVWKKIYFIQL